MIREVTLINDKSKRVYFLNKIHLLANINISIVFGIYFFILNYIDIQFLN